MLLLASVYLEQGMYTDSDLVSYTEINNFYLNFIYLFCGDTFLIIQH